MKVKTKKKFDGRLVRIEGMGDIKEVLINTDLLDPSQRVISICFKGQHSSGIVELAEDEAEDLGKTLVSQARILKNAKVISEVKKK